MAFGDPSSQVWRSVAGAVRSGRRIRMLLCCRTLRSSITTPDSSSSGVERCTSERASRPKECVREHRHPHGPQRGLPRAHGQSRAPTGDGRLGTSKEKPAVDLEVASQPSPPGLPQGHPPLQAPRRAGRAGRSSPGRLGARSAQFFNAAEGLAIPLCRLHF